MSELQRLRDRVEELERALGMGGSFPRQWGLTPLESNMLGLLLRVPVCPRERIFIALWGNDSEVCDKNVEVKMCDLRKKLPKGVTIKTEWNTGYSIDPQSKRLLRALIDAHEKACA